MGHVNGNQEDRRLGMNEKNEAGGMHVRRHRGWRKYLVCPGKAGGKNALGKTDLRTEMGRCQITKAHVFHTVKT